MKKLVLILSILFLTNIACFADSIYNEKGSVISGKIDGVSEGLIQIKNQGSIITLIRKEPSHIYKDIVEARRHFISKQIIKYSGNIIFADNNSVKIMCEDAKVVIPRYKVKNIIMFVP